MTPLRLTNPCLIDPDALTNGLGDLLTRDGGIAGLCVEAPMGTVFDCCGLCVAPDITDFSVKIVGTAHV